MGWVLVRRGRRRRGRRGQGSLSGWAETSPAKRANYLFKFKALLDEQREEIARRISAEHGKTHADALGEVARGIEVVDFVCGIPHLLKGDFSRNVGPNIDTYSDRESWASWRASLRSIFPPWFRCGCTRWPSPAATLSSSSLPSATHPQRCSSPNC